MCKHKDWEKIIQWQNYSSIVDLRENPYYSRYNIELDGDEHGMYKKI